MAVFVFKSLGSTNAECKNPCYDHGDVVVAREQTAGRGQRGNRWSSRAGENLTFSVVLKPTFLAARDQFRLSEAVALALYDTLRGLGIESRIKWTNDIYVADEKVCGILIEHDLGQEGNLARTIVGIGLNVNQREFDAWVPNPTSVALLTGREHRIEEVFERLYDALMARYGALECAPEQLHEEYNRLLYRLGEQHTYRLPSGEEFVGTVRSVEPDGELIVEHAVEGFRRGYLFKEVEFVIAPRGDL